jgi:two-component system, OmpR family, sensor histidine kinase KdpD
MPRPNVGEVGRGVGLNLNRLRLPVVRMLLALGAVAATSAILLTFRPWIDTAALALLFLLPVGVATAWFGQGPGIAAAILSFLAFNYLFVPPYYSLRVLHADNVVALIVFLIVAVVTNQLVGRTRRSLEIATDREREATRLYELSAALIGVIDVEAIVQVLAAQVQVACQPDHLEVQLRVDPGGPAARAIGTTGTHTAERRPTISIPVQGSQGLLGEIALWMRRMQLAPSQERLLRAMAGQTALALDRARLAQAESRARVLEQSDALKSALLSSVSHELRTPLATIKASVTSLSRGDVEWDTEARRDLLEAIEEEADHLNHLVGNLLDSSRLEAGSLSTERTWNELAEIVRAVQARMRTALRNHKVEIDVSDDLPLVPVDFVQIEQVFANLLSNSAKYSPAGTTIRIRARPRKGQELLVQVENQSPPVRDEDLGRIFDRFYRVTAADRVTGTGLGLSICKGIVEGHGGRIWANNIPGGLVFSFSLPLLSGGLTPLPEEDV